MEVLVQVDAGDLIQDVDDGMGVTVRDAAVVFIAIPAVRLWTPYTAVAFEFVNTDSFGELCRQTKVDGLEDRLDDAPWHVVAPCDLGEREGGSDPGEWSHRESVSCAEREGSRFF